MLHSNHQFDIFQPENSKAAPVRPSRLDSHQTDATRPDKLREKEQLVYRKMTKIKPSQPNLKIIRTNYKRTPNFELIYFSEKIDKKLKKIK